MDNTIDALRNLYEALGGDSADVQSIVIIPDMINAIATLVSSGGTAELPTVSSTDDGKVLTVVDGEWAAADIPATSVTPGG